MLTGVAPSLLLLVSKIIIDETSRLVQSGPVSDPLKTLRAQPVLLGAISAFVVGWIVFDSVDTVSLLQWRSLNDRVEGAAKARIFETVARSKILHSLRVLNSLICCNLRKVACHA